MASSMVYNATLTAEDEEKAITLPPEGRVTRSRAKALLEATQSLIGSAYTSHDSATPLTSSCIFFITGDDVP